MEEKTIKLKYPIPIFKEGGGTVELSTLKLKRLKVKHLKKMPAGFMADKGGNIEFSELAPLLAALTDLPESTIDELDVSDLVTLAEEMESFLQESLLNGKI